MTARVLPNVLQTITGRPGDVVYVNDIVEATGFTEMQVKHAMYNAFKNDLLTNIEVVIRANAWRYRPPQTMPVVTHQPSPDAITPPKRVIATPSRAMSSADDSRSPKPAPVSAARSLQVDSEMTLVFEVVGKLADGGFLLRGSNDIVYTAREFKL